MLVNTSGRKSMPDRKQQHWLRQQAGQGIDRLRLVQSLFLQRLILTHSYNTLRIKTYILNGGCIAHGATSLHLF